MTNPVFTAPPVRGAVRLELHYDVADAEAMRDNNGSMFVPETATVSFVDGRPSYINAKGRRVSSGRYTAGGFGIEADGSIRADHRGYEPPRWMVETVEKAMQHVAVRVIREACSVVDPARG